MDGRAAGFTIIEVLVALAVVAVSIVAIGSVMSTNARGV
ncbi:MAG: prepilin-type N-terminal cleavage/methylation domain-containing protein, partial [Bradyrhizobium sp.]